MTELSPQLIAYIDPQLFWENLDAFQDGLSEDRGLKMTAGTVAITSLAMTAGYMFWLVKGGYLLASVMSQLPAWQFMDPLPIFDAVDGGWAAEDEEEEEEEDSIF